MHELNSVLDFFGLFALVMVVYYIGYFIGRFSIVWHVVKAVEQRMADENKKTVELVIEKVHDFYHAYIDNMFIVQTTNINELFDELKKISKPNQACRLSVKNLDSNDLTAIKHLINLET